MDRQHARANMIEQQIRPWDVLDQRVLDVLGEVPREAFVEARYHGVAYSDHPLPIGHDQTMLNPNVAGRLLQSLTVKTTDSVLEIGTGSGYLSTCLSRLSRKVDTLEISEPLLAAAQARLQQMSCSNVTCHQQDASLEWDADDAYDAIAFSGSLEAVPEFYKNKMAINGRLFVILGKVEEPTMEATLLTRISESEWLSDSLFETHAPALKNFDSGATTEQAFVF